ncbi:glycerol kinase GlpK [Gilvimarinus agarilyticus]|uniref:glycerol kinase GlpK n=1 Tax=unclassified Gilvimarinus TaxID=2642066 RepID=UPI001C088007|nr:MULTISPECIES: glycerol kinase GlpK [unclassified Gilvimarinus]MBU2886787.1 glycerol kinase GlpK [Gilvimarinus agarilyticus]MDO6571454.1 glycerol kinase GlpK [Gilvimarinus sp. 2_MG-2023]MDO6746208.1 glycerol kinase GlpK [Gilvimarinus sp. 1_MG-2023]
MDQHILAIDQGTTSSRAIVFAPNGDIVSDAQREFDQHFPADGWVEHDPQQIWRVTSAVCREALAKLPPGTGVAGIGITNQRETTVVWNRASGEPIYPAIVWQDRRTAKQCQTMRAADQEADITERTGLLLDPYFSATKIAWILDHVEGARQQAEAGELAFGTMDTWLIWQLTGGKVHATDATNASRTLLFNIHTQRWDQTLLDAFAIPAGILPEVYDCAADFGLAIEGLGGQHLPIAGVAGDQHAAMVGQGCFKPGMIKSTYGTGCFALMHTGSDARTSRNRLLTTVAYRLNGKPQYALEGSIFMAGATVQWLRDKLGIINHASDTEVLAASLSSNKGVYLVPAFTGLGAPHWQPQARAVICGLTRDSGRAEIARAALEAVCYQTHDLLQAMTADAGHRPDTIRVDGGMIANNWLMQTLTNITDTPAERPHVIETTALGAARLAGLQLGIYPSLEDIASDWQLERRCEPAINPAERCAMLEGWQRAINRARQDDKPADSACQQN